jgi:hypothetical protein
MKRIVGSPIEFQQAYVTVLSTENYLPGVLVLYDSLQRVRARHPLVVLAGSDISSPVLGSLERQGIPVIPAGVKLELPGQTRDRNVESGVSNWNHTLEKLLVLGLDQFAKIVFLDSDIIVLRNIDHLFGCPHMSAVAAGRNHPGNEHWTYMNTGVMVIEPSAALARAAHEVLPSVIEAKGTVSDQDVINALFPDWWERKELHLHDGYNMKQIYMDHHIRHLGYKLGNRVSPERRIHVVHYVTECKPWMMDREERRRYLIKMKRQRHWVQMRMVMLYWWREAVMRLREGEGLRGILSVLPRIA